MGIGLKAFVDRRLGELGRNPFEAARIGNLERTFVSDIVSGRKLSVQASYLPKLAKALDTTAAEIIAATSNAAGEPRAAPRRSSSIRKGSASEMARDVPIFGTARGAMVGKAESFSLDQSKVVDYVRRPPALVRAEDAYAIYVAGESMAPMHEQGGLRFVHPGRPNRPGDTVIVLQSISGRLHAFIKTLLEETADVVRTRQLNPRAEIEFKRPTIVGLHHVMTINEMFEA